MSYFITTTVFYYKEKSSEPGNAGSSIAELEKQGLLLGEPENMGLSIGEPENMGLTIERPQNCTKSSSRRRT